PIDYGVTGIDLTNRVSGKADGLSDINDFVGPSNAHTKGAWSAAAEWPLSAIHAALLPTGHVATYGTDELGNNASGFIYDLWNPHMGLGASAHNTLDNKTNTNTFCSAQTVLSNGQLLISGGDENGLPDGYKGDGISQSVLLNPVTEKMSRAAKMSYARWYPTLVGLPNGENLILGGRSAKPRDGGKSYGVRTPEIYNTNTGKYRKLTGINNDFFERSWYYPRAYVGNTGKVFITRNGSHDVWRMSWTGKGSIEKNVSTRGEVFSQQYPSVVYRPGKVLTLTKGKGAKILDIRGNNATISSTSALGVQRLFSDATVLSDGRVLVTGGSSIRQDLASAHYKAQIWSPGNGKWRDLASASKARLYHSTALLLPNGAVLVTGGGPPGPVVNMNAEIFYPPYLFKKDGSGELANRPSISSMPAVKYGQKFAINYSSATAIKRVAMIRVGSVTHSFDQSQRYVPLSFTTSRNKLIINGPKNKNQAPPGQYMLVIIDKNGVPSHAEMFQPS
ncbi:MAG: galactose oxidase-like domain-containing protein, partial [Granulosicoccaceae bacterium]